MATLNYVRRLQNLQDRKFDRELRATNFSNSATASDIPDNVKYMVEAMRPIDDKYNQRTVEAATRAQNHLENGFQLHVSRAYRTQGSVKTKTNIKVHSDFDLLTIIDRYNFPENQPVPPERQYTASEPDADIHELRKQATEILKKQYDEVDDSGDKSISIFNKALNRKVDVVFCFWYRSNKYDETQNEHYNAVYLYNFPKKQKMLDYPFATIANVNYKGDITSDGSRRGIRLLKTLRADSETELKTLKSFQLTSIVHSISDDKLQYTSGTELNIAKVVSDEMKLLLDDPTYRKAVKSPNGLENPFEKDDVISDIKSLKEDLDTLILDTSKEILSSPVVKRALLTY
jgi:hypothetical protein